MLKGIPLEKLPPGSTVANLGAPAGAFGGEDYDEKWLNDNLAGHDRPLVLRLRIRADIGQTSVSEHVNNAAALAPACMRFLLDGFESVYADCGATQTEIDTYHLRWEPVRQATSGPHSCFVPMARGRLACATACATAQQGLHAYLPAAVLASHTAICSEIRTNYPSLPACPAPQTMDSFRFCSVSRTQQYIHTLSVYYCSHGRAFTQYVVLF